MNGIVVYGSSYGSTKKYAEVLSEHLNFDCYSYDSVDKNTLNNYELIVYGGGLYAGGVKGLKKTVKMIDNINDKNIIIFTVGLADPTDEKNIKSIRKALKNQVPEEVYDEKNIFHLRGGIDYKKLSFIHKTAMTFLYNKVKKIPENERDATEAGIVETFNKKIDFVDFESLKELESFVLSK